MGVVGEDGPERHVLARRAHVLLAEVLRVARGADGLAQAEAPQRLADAGAAVPQVRRDGPEGLQDLGRELVDVGAVEEARVLVAEERAVDAHLGQRVGPRLLGAAAEAVAVSEAALHRRVSLEGASHGLGPGERLGGGRKGGGKDEKGGGGSASVHLGIPGIREGSGGPILRGQCRRASRRGRASGPAGRPGGDRASPRRGHP